MFSAVTKKVVVVVVVFPNDNTLRVPRFPRIIVYRNPKKGNYFSLRVSCNGEKSRTDPKCQHQEISCVICGTSKCYEAIKNNSIGEY